MLCPEGFHIQNENLIKENDLKMKNIPAERSNSGELNTYKNPKTWKKSITNFFRNQIRSTRSNDGDQPCGSKEQFDDKAISREQKWQSLGKVFRRQSLAEHWSKTPNQHGECSSPNKRLGIKKVLSSYFGKTLKSSVVDEN